MPHQTGRDLQLKEEQISKGLDEIAPSAPDEVDDSAWVVYLAGDTQSTGARYRMRVGTVGGGIVQTGLVDPGDEVNGGTVNGELDPMEVVGGVNVPDVDFYVLRPGFYSIVTITNTGTTNFEAAVVEGVLDETVPPNARITLQPGETVRFGNKDQETLARATLGGLGAAAAFGMERAGGWEVISSFL